jgi:hypothetical protein
MREWVTHCRLLSAMKSPLVVTFILFSALCHAEIPEDVIIAAMKLSEQQNYSWVSTVSDDARTYEIEGKSARGGYSWVRLPAIEAIAKRLGRRAEPQIEAFFKGGMGVLHTDDGWQTLEELPACDPDWIDDKEDPPAFVIGSRSRVDDPFGIPGTPALPLVPTRRGKSQIYSNAQFGLSLPHEELAVIVSSCTELHVRDSAAVGVLSDLGAQLLLVRDGQEHIEPLGAAGVFELQITNGMVLKYATRLEGMLKVDGKKVHVHQISETAVTNVGRTSFEVPDQVRLKLEP